MAKGSKTEYLIYSSYAALHKARALKRRLASSSKKKPKPTPSIRALKEAAPELGIVVEELVDGAYEFKLGDLTRRVRKGPVFDLENAFTYWLCGNKFATYELLRKYGFHQVPNYARYSLATIKEARNDFLARNKAVVIKPCSGTSGGRGVTADIRQMSKLNKAIYNSLMYDGTFLMEDFIEGDHFRVLLFKDRVMHSFQRIPASVIGDGTNNLKELIRIDNEVRAKGGRFYPIVIDTDVKQCLFNKNITLNYVPKRDETVYVKTTANFSAGGTIRDIEGVIHEDIIRDCRRIMKIMDIKLGGIDIITKSIDRPLIETGGVINEVNTSPGLPTRDKNVIRAVLNLMFERDPLA